MSKSSKIFWCVIFAIQTCAAIANIISANYTIAILWGVVIYWEGWSLYLASEIRDVQEDFDKMRGVAVAYRTLLERETYRGSGR